MADLDFTADAPGTALPCELTARLVVSPARPVLAGHFPGAPLVPGVLLLDAVRRAWELARGGTATLVAVDVARWFAPVAPGVVVTLRARAQTATDGGVAIAGEWHGAAGRVAAFALRLGERPPG